MRLIIILALLVPAVFSQVKFGKICSGNPTNRARGCDGQGCGNHGASRNGRTHDGLDIVCNDGATVYAPFDLTLKGKSFPYGKPSVLQKKINDGVNLSGKGLCVKLWYVKPDKYYGPVKKGEKIGVLLPMQEVYDGITSHVHVQMCDKSDPKGYF